VRAEYGPDAPIHKNTSVAVARLPILDKLVARRQAGREEASAASISQYVDAVYGSRAAPFPARVSCCCSVRTLRRPSAVLAATSLGQFQRRWNRERPRRRVDCCRQWGPRSTVLGECPMHSTREASGLIDLHTDISLRPHRIAQCRRTRARWCI